MSSSTHPPGEVDSRAAVHELNAPSSSTQETRSRAGTDASHAENASTSSVSVSSPHLQPFLIGMIIFGCVTFLSLYGLFYNKVFNERYHLPLSAIRTVQGLFMAWNAINDPLMGYMQDIGFCGQTWMMDRLKVVRYAGPAFAFSFLLFWFPWSTTNVLVTGAHLLVSLCVFDTLLTLVLSAYCGILVEASTNHRQRVRCVVYGEILGLLGGFVVFPVNYLSAGLTNYGTFQICAVVAATAGAMCMSVAAHQLQRLNKRQTKKADAAAAALRPAELSKDADVAVGILVVAERPPRDELVKELDDKTKEESGIIDCEGAAGGLRRAFAVSLQILLQLRFVCLVGGQFFRIMRTTAMDGFLIILIEALVSPSGLLPVGSAALSAYYVLVRSAGSLLFMSLYRVVGCLGTHRTMYMLNSLALVNVAAAFFVGRQPAVAVAVFIAVEMMLAQCGNHSFYMLIAGEVVDGDKKRHDRPSPLSTLIFTLKAFFTKPADQLAPIVMLTLLERHSYDARKPACIRDSMGNLGASVANSTTIFESPSPSPVEAAECASLFNGMHSSLVFVVAAGIVGELVFLVADFVYTRYCLNRRQRRGVATESGEERTC